MVLTITLTGEADFDQLEFLSLQNMPNELKWYQSKHSTQPSKTDSGHSIHTMEYIVQALKPGTYQIPEQTVHYFDTQERRYKTISTIAIALQINGHVLPIAPADSASSPLENGMEDDDIRPLHEEGPWIAQSSRFIAWRLYWALIFMLALVWLLLLVFIHSDGLLKRLIARIKKKSPYALARKQIYALNGTDQYDRLYSIFLYLGTQISSTDTQLSTVSIEHMLAHAGASATILQEWRLFFEQLEQARYSYTTASSHPDLIAQSLHWIDVLEKLSKGVTHEQI